MIMVLGGLFSLMLALSMAGDTNAAIAAALALIILGAWELR